MKKKRKINPPNFIFSEEPLSKVSMQLAEIADISLDKATAYISATLESLSKEGIPFPEIDCHVEEKPIVLNKIDFVFNDELVAKIEESIRINEEYKEKTKDANFGVY